MEIRKLTREEQLEYLIPFLKSQIEALQYDLDAAIAELENIQSQKLERKKYD